jgi:RNA polymerase sigma-70 factor (sigma-E family)
VDYEQFVAERRESLRRFARALTGDPGLGDDLVQDALLQLHQRKGQLAGIANPDAYARRIVVNAYVSWGRRWFRIRPTEDLYDAVVRDPSDRVADRDQLRRDLYTLPRRQRAVLVLRYFVDLDDAAIAAELNCSISTVRSHASRALAALRVEISARQAIEKGTQ